MLETTHLYPCWHCQQGQRSTRREAHAAFRGIVLCLVPARWVPMRGVIESTHGNKEVAGARIRTGSSWHRQNKMCSTSKKNDMEDLLRRPEGILHLAASYPSSFVAKVTRIPSFCNSLLIYSSLFLLNNESTAAGEKRLGNFHLHTAIPVSKNENFSRFVCGGSLSSKPPLPYAS